MNKPFTVGKKFGLCDQGLKLKVLKHMVSTKDMLNIELGY